MRDFARKVYEMQKKIFAFFRESFRSLKTLTTVHATIEQSCYETGFYFSEL